MWQCGTQPIDGQGAPGLAASALLFSSTLSTSLTIIAFLLTGLEARWSVIRRAARDPVSYRVEDYCLLVAPRWPLPPNEAVHRSVQTIGHSNNYSTVCSDAKDRSWYVLTATRMRWLTGGEAEWYILTPSALPSGSLDCQLTWTHRQEPYIANARESRPSLR